MSTPIPQENVNVSPQVLQVARDTLSINSNSFTPLEEIESDRYLGVILDNKLSFNSHIDEITKKATNLLNLCRRNLHMCSQDSKEIAYNSLVRPHLEYASAAWSPHTQRNILKIESVQRRAARFILKNYTYGTDAQLTHQINTQLKWLSLQHRRTLTDLSLFYKIKNKLVNISFPPTVLPSFRNNIYFQQIQSLHSDAHKYHFFTRTIRIWNLLPPHIVTIDNLDSFKNETKLWITPLKWTKLRETWTLV